MSLTDDELVTRAKAGDRDALSQLLQKHGPTVRRGLHINPKWRSVLEADDVMQVTYFDAFEHIAEFRSDSAALAGWLRRIAQNNLRDAVAFLSRSKRPHPDKRVGAVPEQDSVVQLYELITGTGTAPSGQLSSEETRRILKREMAGLPEDYERVLRLTYFESMPVAEVATAIGRTPGAVYLLRLRAVERLRTQLGSGSRFFSR